MAHGKEKRFAVLIDAENIASKYITTIFNELSSEGIVTYKRVYGDWTKGELSPWKETMLEYSILPVHQFSYTKGKNSTDSAMIIDAMDILYSENVEGFCIVASDSDYTRLSARLRESGMIVIGMGEKKTPSAFIKACNRFCHLDKLYSDHGTVKGKAGDGKPFVEDASDESEQVEDTDIQSPMTGTEDIKNAVIEIIKVNSDDDGFILSSTLGNLLRKRYPDFDSRNYGFDKFYKMIDSWSICEKKYDRTGEGPQRYLHFKLKD